MFLLMYVERSIKYKMVVHWLGFHISPSALPCPEVINDIPNYVYLIQLPIYMPVVILIGLW